MPMFPAYWWIRKKLTEGVAIEYELLSLPLYLVGQAQRLMELRLKEL
jgi:DNA-directed RNA polymerase sigma subunit (sigma70/sigma32)